MFPSLAAGICFLLCCSVAVPRAEAWHTLMHPEIAVRAFEALPEAMKEPLREHLAVVSWASMVPDVVLQDWEHHDWNVHGDAGPRRRKGGPAHAFPGSPFGGGTGGLGRRGA